MSELTKRQLSCILPSMEMTHLMRHSGFHRERRIRIQYARTWIYIGAEVNLALRTFLTILNDESSSTNLVKLKGNRLIQTDECIRHTPALCITQRRLRPDRKHTRLNSSN